MTKPGIYGKITLNMGCKEREEYLFGTHRERRRPIGTWWERLAEETANVRSGASARVGTARSAGHVIGSKRKNRVEPRILASGYMPGEDFFIRRRGIMFRKLREDLKSIKERDPAARSKFEIFFLYQGFHALIYYRIAHFLYRHKCLFLARWVSQTGRFWTGIEIHPGATIGRGLFIDHGAGVVIGETAEVGDDCTLYQGCTLGGTGKDKGKRHPTLGSNVLVGAGAKILGPFKVGDNARIAANAVVLAEVPENSTAVGVPARIVRRDGMKVCRQELDQVHIPDPVAQELCKMRIRLDALEKELNSQKEAN